MSCARLGSAPWRLYVRRNRSVQPVQGTGGSSQTLMDIQTRTCSLFAVMFALACSGAPTSIAHGNGGAPTRDGGLAAGPVAPDPFDASPVGDDASPSDPDGSLESGATLSTDGDAAVDTGDASVSSFGAGIFYRQPNNTNPSALLARVAPPFSSPV